MNLLFAHVTGHQFRLDLYAAGDPAVRLLTFRADTTTPGRVVVRDSECSILGAYDLEGGWNLESLWAWSLDWLQSRAIRLDGVVHHFPSPRLPSAPLIRNWGTLTLLVNTSKATGDLKRSMTLVHQHVAAPQCLLTTPALEVDTVMQELAPPLTCRNPKAHVRCAECASA